MERFNAQLAYVGTPEGTFTGLASVFGSTALGREATCFRRGAFLETLRQSNGRLPLLYQHDMAKPVGLIERARETNEGLEVAGKVTLNTFGKDVLALMRDGAIDALSIGFDADPASVSYEKHGAQRVRMVGKARLHEVSLVTIGADPLARVRDVHAALREQLAGRMLDAANYSKLEMAQRLIGEVLASEPLDAAAEAQRGLAEAERQAAAHGVRLPRVLDFWHGGGARVRVF